MQNHRRFIAILFSIVDVFLPIPDSLLVNLNEKKELVKELLEQLPKLHCVSESVIKGESEVKSCLGAALQAAFQLMVSSIIYYFFRYIFQV